MIVAPGAIDENFPFACSPGLYGNTYHPLDQFRPACSGRCPAGQQCPQPATIVPAPCIVGHFCPRGSAFPFPCPPGTYTERTDAPDESACPPCPTGHFCNVGQQTPCILGTYNPLRGATSETWCHNCPDHATTLLIGADSSAQCVCDVGFVALPGGRCGCPNGTFYSLETDSCSSCSVGTYNALLGAKGESQCVECPLHTTTSRAGATSFEQCVCDTGRVALPGGGCGCPEGTLYSHTADSCLSCPPFTSSSAGAGQCNVCDSERYVLPGVPASTGNCPACPEHCSCGWNTTVETLMVDRGFWRLSHFSATVYQCVIAKNQTACMGGVAGASSCAPEHTGPCELGGTQTGINLGALATPALTAQCFQTVCQVCLLKDSYFDHDNAVCLSCPESAGSIAAAASVLVAILLFAATLVFLHEQQSAKFDAIAIPLRHLVHWMNFFSLRIGLISKLKLGVSLAQVLAMLDSTYELGLPSSWFRWTAVFRFIGELDWIDWVIPADCIIGSGMTRSLLVRALTPMIFIVSVPLLAAPASIVHARVFSARAGSMENSINWVLKSLPFSRETRQKSNLSARSPLESMFLLAAPRSCAFVLLHTERQHFYFSRMVLRAVRSQGSRGALISRTGSRDSMRRVKGAQRRRGSFVGVCAGVLTEL
jgi:hypothetical protein